ncbi:MAG TPA: efflux RND transporter periplasmic adaptor subunit [Candidatus Acidoferrum sp.]|nr:efflux RND transporter periplasmic adaptor subunit [Candidatus Acidoferrum sp.]
MRYWIHARATELPVETPALRKPQAPPPLQQPPNPRKFPWVTVVTVIALITGVALLAALRHGTTSPTDAPQTETTVAVTKDFVSVLRLTGTTEAVRSRPMLAPRLEGAQLGSMVVTRLTPTGTRVRQGETLVEFDRQAQLKDALDKKGAYQDLEDQLAEKRAAEDAARAKDETELKQAEDDLTKAQLEVSKNDIVSRIDAEKNQETLQEAQATLQQLQQTFKLKREAAAADIRTLDIQARRAQATMLYAEANAKKMTLVAPIDGVVVLNMIWTGGRMGEVQEGDQVRPGVPFMKVVDPSQMEVAVQVNQADFLKLQVGQKAQVHLDAYPGMSFPGTLEEVTPLAHTGRFSEKVRTFSAVFSIEGSNPRLMPDLSAAVDVDLDTRKNALVVPVQSVGDANGREYVQLSRGATFAKREVKTGPRNDLEVVIESGLKPGEKILRDAESGSGLTE